MAEFLDIEEELYYTSESEAYEVCPMRLSMQNSQD
jgi:hypothetical protein